MTYQLPHRLVGTSRIGPDCRAAFGQFLDGAGTEGRGALLTEGGSWVWETLRAGGRLQPWDVCALVPHVAGYVREATDYGMLGAGWRRLRRMSPLSWFRLGCQGMLRARGVLRKDFPTLLVLLLELEMANFRRVRPPVVFLHAQITDLLLAMDHGPALEKAVRRIRRGFGAEPGLATYNAGTLLPRLERWGVEVPYLLTAVHPRGHGMRPTRDDCESALRGFGGRVVATLDGPLTDAVAAYWRERGVASGVYDVPEPQADAWRGMWADWQRARPPQKPSGVRPAPTLVSAT
jgi:hypothetical protein